MYWSKIIRRDRNRLRGGVPIYLNESLKYHVIDDLSDTNLKNTWLQVSTSHLKPFLPCSIYCPPPNKNNIIILLQCSEGMLFVTRLWILYYLEILMLIKNLI